MDDPEEFEKRYETDNFIVKIERPHLGDKDTDIRSKIYASYKPSDISAYFAEHKLSQRQISSFAKAACKAQGIEPGKVVRPAEQNEDQEEDVTAQEELERLLLQKKSEIGEMARRRTEHVSEEYGRDEEDDQEDPEINKILRDVYQKDNPTVDDFTNIQNFNEIQEANQDLILRQGDNLLLTNKGKIEAEQLLGVKRIENIEEKAEEVLEEEPLVYFLDAIDEVHKGDEELKIWELISALSAKCSERQIHSWAVGPSGKGKSHIKRAIIEFLPEDAYECPNSMTPKAMLYKTQKEGTDYFKGKLLFLDEAEGYDSDDAVVLLRGLTDPDEDTFIHEMVKDQSYEQLIIEKPITVWFTSVESINDEQLKNRFVLTNPDGSSELDQKVFEHQQNKLHTGKELGRPPAEAQVVREMLSKIRNNTAGLTPIVPFEVNWKQKFNRRLYPYFVTLMEIIAKINYKNRVIDDKYIYVTRADFRTAAVIWAELIDTTIAQTDTDALNMIMQLPEREGEAATTSELASRLDGFNTDKVRRKADELRETEELQLINAKKEGNRYEYWAGADKERLINPEPEIKADPETMTQILEKTEKGASELVIKNVNDAEVEVYDQLKERQQQRKEEKMEEVNDWTVEWDEEEDKKLDKKMLKQLEDFSFSVSLQEVVAMGAIGEDDAWDSLERLEEKGLIKIQEEDGKEYPRKTRTYKQVRSEGKLVL